MDELTNYQLWQLENKGNILPEPFFWPDGSVDAREDDLRRMEEWFNLQSSLLIQDYYEY